MNFQITVEPVLGGKWLTQKAQLQAKFRVLG